MIIYKIINTINGKIYIGQTVQTLKKRFRGHCNPKKDSYLTNAILKYGKENFKIEEIDRANSLDELNQKEVYWIEYHNSRDRLVGYNLKEGGDSSPCHEETKIKIGIANSNKTASPETRAKQSAARKGKPLSDETKRKMSESRKGRIVLEETKTKIGAKHKGKEISLEAREKMSAAKIGKRHLTSEQYKALGEKQRGKKRPEVGDKLRGLKRDPEIGKKISESKMGRKHNEDTKLKMKQKYEDRMKLKNATKEESSGWE